MTDKPQANPSSIKALAEQQFGKVLGTISTQDGLTLLAIERRLYSGAQDSRFMTMRHHEHGGFHWGHYDLTKAKAMYDLIDFADKQFNPLNMQCFGVQADTKLEE